MSFFSHGSSSDNGDTGSDLFVVAQEYASASPIKLGLAADSFVRSLRTLSPAVVIRPVRWIHKLVHAMPAHPMAAQPWNSVWYGSQVR